jgi:hypothetical protein
MNIKNLVVINAKATGRVRVQTAAEGNSKKMSAALLRNTGNP